jgi:hypothetical protein
MSTTSSGTTSTGDGSPVAHRGGVVASLWFGMFVGALFGSITHAALRAERYDLVVDESVADEAARLLGATEPASALG